MECDINSRSDVRNRFELSLEISFVLEFLLLLLLLFTSFLLLSFLFGTFASINNVLAAAGRGGMQRGSVLKW